MCCGNMRQIVAALRCQSSPGLCPYLWRVCWSWTRSASLARGSYLLPISIEPAHTRADILLGVTHGQQAYLLASCAACLAALSLAACTPGRRLRNRFTSLALPESSVILGIYARSLRNLADEVTGGGAGEPSSLEIRSMGSSSAPTAMMSVIVCDSKTRRAWGLFGLALGKHICRHCPARCTCCMR